MAVEQILTVNPRRRKRRRSAKRARRRMPAALRRYWATHSRKRKRHANPRRRHHSSGGYRMRRRRHRNPRFGGVSVKGVTHALIPAGLGAVGAIALDVGMAYLPLPAALQSGWGKTLAQIAGALGLGFIAGKVVGREKAKAFTLGALTIVAYNTIKPLLSSSLGANVKGLSGLADFQDYRMVPGMGAYMNPAPMLAAGGSGLRTRQLGAYMAMGGGGYSDSSMD